MRKAMSIFGTNPDAVFKNVKGVIHVGANSGQERDLYDQNGLSVVWIEPIPHVFERLRSNLTGFTRQIAIEGLVTDLDDIPYQFHIASNDGESSSIFDMDLHKEVWPEVTYEKTISLRSRTLPSLLKEHGIDNKDYDMLVLDTQGAELLVLKGAAPLLPDFKYIKAEVPDFEAYKGCCQVGDLELFLDQHGFKEYNRHQFAKRNAGGRYYDIIYRRS